MYDIRVIKWNNKYVLGFVWILLILLKLKTYC